jgi:hypothetical protein
LQKQTAILIQQHLKQTQRVNDNKNDKLKVAKKNTSNKFIMQLSQAGTDKNPLQNRIPGITHILQLVMTIPSLISNYAVKVRRQELRAGGNKFSAARGLRRII